MHWLFGSCIFQVADQERICTYLTSAASLSCFRPGKLAVSLDSENNSPTLEGVYSPSFWFHRGIFGGAQSGMLSLLIVSKALLPS